MNGWIILDKPVGLGSTQAVAAVKRAMRDGGYDKCKIGHGGTLDPLASGVLPIALGEATKLAGRMLESDKIYDFTLGFGVETDTLDGEGVPVATSDVRPSLAAAETVLSRFTGPISQIPPAYSALRIDGERAYDRARAGQEVVLASRPVTIHSLYASPVQKGVAQRDPGADTSAGVVDCSSVGSSIMPIVPRCAGQELEQITLTAHVSKGTYIRSLARDIARALGTYGQVTMLRRTKAGPFGLDSAISLDKLAELGKARALEDILLPMRAGLDDIPALSLTPDQAGALRQGRVLVGIAADDGQYFACADDVPVALVEVRAQAVHVVRGFNP